MSVWAIVVAAGTGTRFGGGKPKPLADLGGKPVVVRSLQAFHQCAMVDGIILVGRQESLNEYKKLVRDHGLGKVKALVAGGDTRTASVRAGIAALAPGVTIVMVHDGVRPLVASSVIVAGLEAVKATGAAVAAVPVKSTVKAVDPRSMVVTETFDRSLLWEVQTPQVFERRLLERAYREDTDGATDDAALIERMGMKVSVFMGTYENIKITTPEDLVVARALLGRVV